MKFLPSVFFITAGMLEITAMILLLSKLIIDL